MKIEKNIYIDELVDELPKSVEYLMDKGIKCIACGEPIWGTLEEAAKEKGFADEDIQLFVKELNLLYDNLNYDYSKKETVISVNKYGKK